MGTEAVPNNDTDCEKTVKAEEPEKSRGRGILVKVITKVASKALGVKVDLASAKLQLCKGHISIRGLEVHNVEGFYARHLLLLDDAEIDIDLKGALKSKFKVIEFTKVVVEGLHLTLEKSLTTSNLATLVDKLDKKDADAQESTLGKAGTAVNGAGQSVVSGVSAGVDELRNVGTDPEGLKQSAKQKADAAKNATVDAADASKQAAKDAKEKAGTTAEIAKAAAAEKASRSENKEKKRKVILKDVHITHYSVNMTTCAQAEHNVMGVHIPLPPIVWKDVSFEGGVSRVIRTIIQKLLSGTFDAMSTAGYSIIEESGCVVM